MQEIKSVYFVGAGGIGMSALERYFLHNGIFVGGYDKTPAELTERLREEGAQIHYEENVDLIPAECRDPQTTLVVYTPAIPAEHKELVWFREARPSARHSDATDERALCGWNTWKNHHNSHDSSPAP